jgi:hypothetical protein
MLRDLDRAAWRARSRRVRPHACGTPMEPGEYKMSAFTMRHGALAALAAATLFGGAWSTSYAEIRDYEFRLVKAEVKKGDTEVAVRLVNKKTGKTVPEAVIFAKRIDMAPEGMATMASPLEPLPSTEPGVYRFKTNLSMEGKWQLSLGAKVQGEDGSVENKLIVKASP